MNPLDYLFSLEFHGIKLGLENITALLRAANNPEKNYPAIHIAGTNGKGSVAAFLDAAFAAAGYRTGRFTSPHLTGVRERFLVDQTPITPEEIESDIEYFRNLALSLPNPPTFFEVNTAIAYRHFHRHHVDVAIVEVGMGGRFDSTNVIQPLCAAVTNIALEHTAYLGDTLEAIAFEKAGIIKPNTPVVVGEQHKPAQAVILQRARELDAPVSLLHRDFTFQLQGPPFQQQFIYRGPALSFGPLPLALPGEYQGQNAAIATAIAEKVQPNFPKLTESAIRQGLAKAKWPCRLEQVLADPPVIIDVAHNAAAAQALARSLPKPSILVLAVAVDKDAVEMLNHLAPLAHPLILTQFDGPRAMPLEKLTAAAGNRDYLATPRLEDAVAKGISLARKDLPLVIAGSLFTAGQARTLLTEKYGAPPIQF